MKTFFCSDTHFNHPNILKYEPNRVEAIAEYIIKNNLSINLFKDLDALRDKYNEEKEGWDYVPHWSRKYVNYYFQEKEHDIFDLENNEKDILALKRIFNELLTKDYIIRDKNLEKEEDYNNKRLQKVLIEESINVILRYQTEMMIERWNKVVSKDDIVYFLGDFGFGDNQKLEEIGRRLNGHKIIILGNHDKRKHNPDGSVKYNSTLEKHFKAAGFERVEFNPIILKGYFIISHEPLYYMNESISYYNIYGHVHSNPIYKTKTENSCCVCLDRWGYSPIEIEDYNNYII